jgi:hypothetical protein
MMARTRFRSVLVFVLPFAVGMAVTSMLLPLDIETRVVDRAQASAWPSDETTPDSLDAELLFAEPTRVLPIDAEAVLQRLDAEKLRLERAEEPAAEQPTPIPEPSPGLLLVSGLIGLAVQRRVSARPRG